MSPVIQIVTGALGSLGFSVLFNIRGKKLLITTLGGLISWSVFLLLEAGSPENLCGIFLP